MRNKKIIIIGLILLFILSQLIFGANSYSVKNYYKGRFRVIESNGIPKHNIPQLNNKNSYINLKQKIVAKIPLLPKVSSKPIPLETFAFGITNSGVIIDASPIRYWLDKPALKWEYNYFYPPKKVDKFNGFLNKKGEYFYKGSPLYLTKKYKIQKLIGYAADGFPIYNDLIYKKNKVKKLKPSYKLKKGQRINGPSGNYNGQFNQDFIYIKNSGDLDRCNGRFGITKEYKKGTYYYVLTSVFPYIPRCFKGVPDNSFLMIKKQNPKPKKNFMRNSNY